MEVTYVNVPKAVIIKQNVVPKNVNIITKKIKLHRKEPTKMKKKFLSIIFILTALFIMPLIANAESEEYDYRGMLLYTINDSKTAITITNSDFY